MKTFEIVASSTGHSFGTYEGETPEAAIQAMLDDAGHKGAADSDVVETEVASSPAFLAGVKDGLAWDLDGFAGAAAVQANKTGWDESTINAVGKVPCAKAWGVDVDGDTWEAACEDYNRGAYQGATADQAERTGLPTREG